MKNKNYYMDLADRWFDALLTGDEERELKSFLATTEDPDFDEVKAVAGFFATGKALSEAAERQLAEVPASSLPFRFRWAATVAIAASLALVAAIGLYHRQDRCYVLAYGEKSTDPQLALESMDATLTGLFSAAPDIETELETLMK